jgi:transcriptional regulator with XRE-family HTH domain
MNSIPSEERRVIERLTELVDREDTAQELEQQLGWEEGRLTRLLAGRRRVTVEDLLAVLAHLNIAPSEFFSQLDSSEEAENPSDSEMLAGGLDQRFLKSRQVIEDAISRRNRWKSERGSS